MPMHIIDQFLYSQEHNLPPQVIEKNTGLSSDKVEQALKHINKIKDSTEYIRAIPPVYYLNR
jgi:NAD+ synthase